MFGRLLSQKRGKTLKNMGIAKQIREDLTRLGELFKDGIMAPVIDRRYPLEETVNAIPYIIEHHAHGKIAITMG